MSEGEGNVVAGLLQTFMRQHSEDMKEIRKKLDAGEIRMAGIELTLAEVKRDTTETRIQATRTNGRVTEIEEWKEERQKAIAAEEDFQRGRRAQRADDLEKLDRARSFIEDWWPVGLALVVGAGAVWAYVSWPV